MKASPRHAIACAVAAHTPISLYTSDQHSTSRAVCAHLAQSEGQQERQLRQHVHGFGNSTTVTRELQFARELLQKPKEDVESKPHGWNIRKDDFERQTHKEERESSELLQKNGPHLGERHTQTCTPSVSKIYAIMQGGGSNIVEASLAFNFPSRPLACFCASVGIP